MKQVPRADTAIFSATGEDDPFRYGWRYVRRAQPDGTVVVEVIPSAWKTCFIPKKTILLCKSRCIRATSSIATARWRRGTRRSPMVVLGDCRVDWGVEGIRPLGPHLVVLFEVRQWLRQGTFRLAEEGGRPVLVVEIASPSTRRHDLGVKLDFTNGWACRSNVIVNRGLQNDDPGAPHWLSARRYRLAAAPVRCPGTAGSSARRLMLGIEEDRPWFYDAVTGVREPDRTELRHALADAEARLQDAEARAQAEAQARAVLEERLRP